MEIVPVPDVKSSLIVLDAWPGKDLVRPIIEEAKVEPLLIATPTRVSGMTAAGRCRGASSEGDAIRC